MVLFAQRHSHHGPFQSVDEALGVSWLFTPYSLFFDIFQFFPIHHLQSAISAQAEVQRALAFVLLLCPRALYDALNVLFDLCKERDCSALTIFRNFSLIVS